MKTIVLFFVLLAAFAAVTAKHNKKQKSHESSDGPEDAETHDWPQPENIGEFGVPEGYDGPATSGGQGSGGPGSFGGFGGQGSGSNDDSPAGKSHVRTSRRHN